MAELQKLRDWILSEGCTHVAMESTGAYWKPVFNVLEEGLTVYIANPHEVKARKGHKTDNGDAWWLAHLLRHGMITPSFIPPRAQRELRDLTRRRKRVVQNQVSEKNRIDKILQDANVKLSDVLTDLFGMSGQLMLDALLEGKLDAAAMAAFAKGSAKKKVAQLEAALEGHQLSAHHRLMVGFSLTHLRFLEEQLNEIDSVIREHIQQSGYQTQFELLQTLPGVRDTSAAVLLAEVGPDVKAFASEKKLSSWAGVCPGNNRSAGRNKSSATTAGSPWLRASLVESAWAASRMKQGHLKEKYHRLAHKSRPKALIAIAHDLLVLAYFVLQRGTPYEETRDKPMSDAERAKRIRFHVRKLGKLGVAVRPRPCAHPPAAPTSSPAVSP